MAGRCNASQDAQDAWDAGDTSLESGRYTDGSDAGSVFADEERKLGGGGIGGGGREERCRGRNTSAKGQHVNRCIGSEAMKRLGAGGRVSGEWLRQGGSNASGRKKGHVQCGWTLTCPSGRIRRGPFASEWNEPGRTHPEQEFTLCNMYTCSGNGTQEQAVQDLQCLVDLYLVYLI